MNCRRFRKLYIKLLPPIENAAEAAALKKHVEACPSCAHFFAEMSQTLAALKPSRPIVASTHFKERVMNKIKEPVMAGNLTAEITNIKRRKFTKLFSSGLFRHVATASALVVALAYVLLLLFGELLNFNQAYSIDQTLKANRDMRFVHMKMVGEKGREQEMWAQFNEKGELIHLLVDYPKTEDGHKTVHWMPDNKAQVWFRTKNAISTAAENDTLGRMKRLFECFDPKSIMEKVDKGVKEGKLLIEQQPATGKDEPITLIVTHKDSKFQRTVYKVDQKSDLIKEIEQYELWDDKYELATRISYSDYNNPTGPEVFNFKPQADTIIVDETTQVLGLAKGDLSDKEIAVKVVREFFEALIAKDYAKAGMLYGGVPASFFESKMGNIKYLKIVSIGDPIPGPEGTGSLKVPCKIEIEVNGKKSIMEPYGPFVRPVYSQRERWAISGGI